MRSGLFILPFVAILFGSIGVAVQSAYSDMPWLAIVFGALATISLVVWIALDIENFKRLFRRKGAKYGASSGLTVLLGIAILVGLAILSTKPRFNKSVDVTRAGINTLSDQSIKVILNLSDKKQAEAPVTSILGFFDNQQQKLKFQELLALYEGQGLDLKVEYVDPQADRTRAIAENITQGNTVIVKRGDQRATVTTFTEEKLTNALIRVMKEGVKKVYFTKGHGEGKITGSEGEGFDIAVEALKNNRYEVEELSLLATGQVPEDADLVVIAGPKYDIKKEEAQLLKNYITQGKPLFVMVDPLVAVPNLNDLLSDYGLKFNQDILLIRADDFRAQLYGQNFALVTNFDSFNPITKDFANQAGVEFLMPSARSLAEITENPNEMKVTMVAKTSEAINIGISNVLKPEDLQTINPDQVKQGSFAVIGVATGRVGGQELASNSAAESETKAQADVATKPADSAAAELRLVATGSSQFATNLGSQSPGNLDMFTNITNYLLQDEDFIAIRPKDLEQTDINLASASSAFSLMFISYLYPFCFLGIGVVYWLKRRRA